MTDLVAESACDCMVAAQPHVIEIKIHRHWLRGDTGDDGLILGIDVDPLSVDTDCGESGLTAIDRVPLAAIIAVRKNFRQVAPRPGARIAVAPDVVDPPGWNHLAPV